MINVSLESQKISICLYNIKGTNNETRLFDPKETEAMGEFIAPYLDIHPLVCSSSVNHPEEEGFADDFNVDGPLGEAVAFARRRNAIRIPLVKDIKTARSELERIVGDRPMPVHVILEGITTKTDVQVDGGVFISFSNQDEFMQFLNGMFYAFQVAAASST